MVDDVVDDDDVDDDDDDGDDDGDDEQRGDNDNDNNDVGEYGEHSNDDSKVNDEYDDDGLTSSVCSSLFLTCQVGISIDFMLAFPLLQCHCQIPRQGLKASLDPKSIAKLSGR